MDELEMFVTCQDSLCPGRGSTQAPPEYKPKKCYRRANQLDTIPMYRA
jgi:hypothetical protein